MREYFFLGVPNRKTWKKKSIHFRKKCQLCWIEENGDEYSHFEQYLRSSNHVLIFWTNFWIQVLCAAVVGELKNARFVATSCSPAHRQSLRVVCLCIAADNVKSIVEFLWLYSIPFMYLMDPNNSKLIFCSVVCNRGDTLI